jgi:crotonobetainyl-CoA:carnitine CoA-transferase CaiB-like acyl-CoA transferase
MNGKTLLEGLKVVEVSTGISVPLAGAALAHLGADVVKVESSQKPDINRVRPRKSGFDADRENESESRLQEGALSSFPQFDDVNSGKRSVLLDLKSPAGRGTFLALLRKADVFVQNFAPGWLDRLDLPVETLIQLNPRLVCVFASAYGQEGPKRSQRAWAPVMSAQGGLEWLCGKDDRHLGDPGTIVESEWNVAGLLGTAYADPNASYFVLLYVLMGLRRRAVSQRGVLIDLSMTEALAFGLLDKFRELSWS